jgi:hypothetical protein
MADLNAVNIKKGRLGANRISNSDAISGIIIGAPVPKSLAHDTAKVIYNLKDAENMGIDQHFDTSQKVHAYRHISEFYRFAQSGTPLYIMVVDPSTTMSIICSSKAKIILTQAKGKIRQLAVAANPGGSAKITMSDGIAKDVHDAISKAQELALWAFKYHMPCQVFLEGYNFGGNAASVLNLKELPNLKATKVSVFIGQDFNYAKKQTGNRQKYADVGTLLGVCAKAKVFENIGNNELFNLTSAPENSWLEPGLSSHQSNDTPAIFEQLQTLEDKGYIFGIEYAGLAGVRINNDHTCCTAILDTNNATNEHTIAYGRVNDKAIRELRKKYLPKVKTDWPVDPKTGKMSPGTVVALEDLGDEVFEDMTKRGEITYGKTTIDKESDLLIAKELKISFAIVPKGSISEINGTINLKTKI